MASLKVASRSSITCQKELGGEAGEERHGVVTEVKTNGNQYRGKLARQNCLPL